MGLDSVELVITIEKHFVITIRDEEAEKAMTVQDVADLVARHRPVVPNGRDVRAEVRSRLVAVLPPGEGPIQDSAPFANVCRGRKPAEIWADWSRTGLRMPDLPPKDQQGRGSSWRAVLVPKWISGRSVLDLMFGQVVDAVVAHNHQALIDPLKPASAYEILMAVIGVSSASLGVPELEIRPTDSYTNDLGID